MGWAEKLPWWVKWAFSGGIGVMSSFAATVVPNWWQWVLFAVGMGLILLAAGGTAWHLLKSRRLQVGPAILIALSVVGLVSGGVWGAFTWKPSPPTSAGEPTQPNTASNLDQPVIVLMDPAQAYDLVWDPAKDLQPLMYLLRKADDPGPRVGGAPTFRIKNVGKDTATQVKVSWAVGDIDVIAAVRKSPYLQKYHAIITDTNLGVFTSPPDEVMRQVLAVGVQAKSISPGGQAYGMYYARASTKTLPYLAPELNNTITQEIVMPYEIVNFLEIYALASMPAVGTTPPNYETTTVPVFVTVSWDIPSGGKLYRYRIDAKFRPNRPWVGGAAKFVEEPPEVMGIFDFFVTSLN